MPRQKREKSGTGICHVMQGKESKTCPSDSERTPTQSYQPKSITLHRVQKYEEFLKLNVKSLPDSDCFSTFAPPIIPGHIFASINKG